MSSSTQGQARATRWRSTSEAANDAVEDGATFPIFYESRIPLEVEDEGLLDEVDAALVEEEGEGGGAAGVGVDALERIVGTRDRL